MTTHPQCALVIVFDGVEELEALATVDILRRADIEVTMASVAPSLAVTGRNRIAFQADAQLSQVESQTFDLVVLPGGPGVFDLVNSARVAQILKAQHARQGEIAAICAAPKVLTANGLLANRSATSHASVQQDLPRFTNQPVVEDGHIVTSQGAGTAVPFALALVRRLCGQAKADEIAASIHFA